MEELKSLPTNIISSSLSIEEYLSGQYTTMTAHNMMGDITFSSLRTYLIQKLPNLVERLNDSCKSAYRDELPDCTGEYLFCFYDSIHLVRFSRLIERSLDWTPINVHPTFLQIVGRMTGRVQVGEALSTTRLYLDTYVKFATSVFVTSSILKVLPAIMRPLVVLFIPDFWRIKKIHRNNWKMLAPVVQGKLLETKEETEGTSSSLFMYLWWRRKLFGSNF